MKKILTELLLTILGTASLWLVHPGFSGQQRIADHTIHHVPRSVEAVYRLDVSKLKIEPVSIQSLTDLTPSIHKVELTGILPEGLRSVMHQNSISYQEAAQELLEVKLLLDKHKKITVGWNKHFQVYVPKTEEFTVVQYNESHWKFNQINWLVMRWGEMSVHDILKRMDSAR